MTLANTNAVMFLRETSTVDDLLYTQEVTVGLIKTKSKVVA